MEGTKPTNPAFLLPKWHRFFTSDGRLAFFNTSEGLVPQDTNKLPDPYEYNMETGRLSLLSTGTGEVGAWFVEASADGRDAFLATRRQLSRWDPDNLDDLYDARVGGGLPEPPAPSTPCEGDACQGVLSAPPSFNTASEFTGLGNSVSVRTAAKRASQQLSRLRQLKRSLILCKKKRSKSKRRRCEAAAHKRFAAKKSGRRAA